MPRKVAVITGGASGIGLAVAKSLALHPSQEWLVHVIDMNATIGNSIASSINATFHKCDLTDYTCLASTLHLIHQQNNRLDFVHANAGILETSEFISSNPGDNDVNTPPPPPNMLLIDVNLKAVITTCWLALHYFRLTQTQLAKEEWEGSLIITGSVGGLYPTLEKPLYTATKFGITGLTRALAPKAYKQRHVRINCICPAFVRTGMMSDDMDIPEENLTPMEGIVQVVHMLIEGKEATDSSGHKIKEGDMFGQAVEISRNEFFFREGPEPDEYMKPMLEAPLN